MVSSNQGVPGDGYSSRGYGAVTLAGISDDGRYTAFESESRNLVGIETFGCNNVYFRDMQTDAPVLISLSDTGMLARGTSRVPVISGDGTAVAFESDARSLVPGDTNGVTDVFVARPSATPVAVTPTGDTSTCNDVPVGDLDCSGAVTAQDVLHLLRALMHIPPYAECRYYSAVFDCFSGKVSALQALAILRYILNGSGLLDCSNVGK